MKIRNDALHLLLETL